MEAGGSASEFLVEDEDDFWQNMTQMQNDAAAKAEVKVNSTPKRSRKGGTATPAKTPMSKNDPAAPRASPRFNRSGKRS